MEINELLRLVASDRGYVRLRPAVSGRPDEIVQILRDSQVWFSSVEGQDDIFEGRPVIRVEEVARLDALRALADRRIPDATPEIREALAREMYERLGQPVVGPELRKEIASGMMRLYGSSSILCLFKGLATQAQWHHYAGAGTGYALVFDMGIPWVFAGAPGMEPMPVVPFPVRYVAGNRPVIEIALAPADPATGFDDIEKALLTKSIDWRHQNESRFIRMGIGSGLVRFPRESLVAIVLGYAASPADKARILEEVAAHSPGLSVFEVSEDPEAYSLALRKVC